MQSPPAACSLAEPFPAASPQLGRWICQPGLRSARIRGLLLVPAAANNVVEDAFFAILRLVIFRTLVSNVHVRHR